MNKQIQGNVNVDQIQNSKSQPIEQVALDALEARANFSPFHFLMVTIGGIFLAEVIAMVIVYGLQDLPYYVQTLIDASIMIIMIFPLIYFLSLKPLLVQIEKQQQMEESLRQSEERFAKAFHSSPAALSITRLEDGSFIDVNQRFLHLSGYKHEEVIGRKIIDLGIYTNPEQRARLGMQIVRQQMLGEEGVHDYQMEACRKSGEIRTVLVSTEAIELGGEQCILSSISDITERTRAEDANRQLSRIVEQTEDTVVVTDREGMIEYVNSAFERLTGYSKEEVLGKTPRVLKSEVHDNEFYRNLWDTILKGDVYQSEIANRRKNGELYYEVKTITPLRDTQGKITHYVATGKDITQHKHNEEELRKAYEGLELRVQERTEELRIAISELEDEITEHRRAEAELKRFNRAMVGRELRMIELKKEVNELCGSTGHPSRYALDFEKG